MKDKRYGFGIIKYIDDSVFEGEWLNDYKHGCSHLRHPDGRVIERWYLKSVMCSQEH